MERILSFRTKRQGPSVNLSQRDLEELADMLATRVCERIEKIISHHKEGAP